MIAGSWVVGVSRYAAGEPGRADIGLRATVRRNMVELLNC
jgi:hypothetical protein